MSTILSVLAAVINHRLVDPGRQLHKRLRFLTESQSGWCLGSQAQTHLGYSRCSVARPLVGPEPTPPSGRGAAEATVFSIKSRDIWALGTLHPRRGTSGPFLTQAREHFAHVQKVT